MPYNPNFYPQNYYQNQPYYQNNMQMQNQQQVATSNAGIIWVQGEAAAKSYPVGAGQSILLMDSEDSVMYIKSTDQSGMPQPLRIFEYTERTGAKNDAGIAKKPTEDFVSRAEFEEFREDVKRSIRGIRKPKIEEEAEG
jgi:hypothetical protein